MPQRVFLLCVLLLPPLHPSLRGAEAEHSVLEQLNSPVTFGVAGDPLGDVLAKLAKACSVKFEVDPAVLVAARFPGAQLPRYWVYVHQLEAKYLIAWVIHLGQARGRIVDGGIAIDLPDAVGEGDAVFQCYRETKGPWRRALAEKLSEGIISARITDSSVKDVIHWVTGMGLGQFILDPAAVSTEWLSARSPPIHAKTVDYEGVLQIAAKATGLELVLQGGVAFLAVPVRGDKAESQQKKGAVSHASDH